MRQIHRWTSLVGATTLLMGLGFLASPGPVVQAVTTVNQIGADIDGENANDWSGFSVAMSADGTRIAIGAPGRMMPNPGYVRVYTLRDNGWQQTGGDIDGENERDESGKSVAMSADGSRIAIGAPGNTSGKGHVRVFSVQDSPGAPTISAITAGDGVLTISFSAGTENGSTITNFKYSIDGTNYIALNPTATTSPFTISGLTNGTSYSVTIKSVNAIGDSPASNAIAGTPVAPATTVSEPTTTTAPTTTTTTTTAVPTTTVAAPTTTTTTTAVPTTTVAAPTATPTKVDSLPETGNNSSTLVFISALLVIGGITLSRRRKVL